MKVFTAALLAGALATATYAVPSLTGPSGGVITPQANNVLVPATVEIALDQLTLNDNGYSLVRANYAASERLEVGVTAQISSENMQLRRLGGSASYQLPSVAGLADYYAAALTYQGSVNGGVAGGPNEILQVSLVGSHNVRTDIDYKKMDVRYPLLFTSYGVNYLHTSGSDTFRPFLGVEAVYPMLDINAEVQAKCSPYDRAALYSVSVRVPVSDNIGIQGGVTNAVDGVFGGEKANAFLGVNVRMAR